jgi:hypothetical protein
MSKAEEEQIFAGIQGKVAREALREVLRGFG